MNDKYAQEEFRSDHTCIIIIYLFEQISNIAIISLFNLPNCFIKYTQLIDQYWRIELNDLLSYKLYHVYYHICFTWHGHYSLHYYIYTLFCEHYPIKPHPLKFIGTICEHFYLLNNTQHNQLQFDTQNIQTSQNFSLFVH